MKFNSFDELIEYLHGKQLSSLEFDIREDGATPPTTDVVPVVPATSTDQKFVDVTFNSLSDNQTSAFQVANESYLLVSEFEHIPNGCSTTRLHLWDRELIVRVCEENKVPTARFDVTVNGEKYTNKKFILVTDTDKYMNTICFDD